MDALAFQPKSFSTSNERGEEISQEDVINSLPEHLQPFVAVQDYSAYTPRDHAAWRFLIKQLKENLEHSAHPTYIEGMEKTGLSEDAIPRIETINSCLDRIGWRAVVVDGFLPPAIFMEFQALRVLVIAVNMRSYENMLYTPAPDIVHESAGHAPFLIDVDYSEFLQRFGELGMKAIPNSVDVEMYEAIRNLSILKELDTATDEQILEAERRLEKAKQLEAKTSESALLARLHWWTVEYGLVGDISDYTIYGAGLLSSLGESMTCLDDATVTKNPLTVNAIDEAYDITAPQPQLFVAESCRHLSQVLETFANKMAAYNGGQAALEVAVEAQTVCTACYSSGLQVSGILSEVLYDSVGNPTYLRTEGKSQLAYDRVELPGQGIAAHPQGFGSPVGRLVGFERCLSSYSIDELKKHGIYCGNRVILRYLSGVTVEGNLIAIERREQKNVLFNFIDCTVRDINGDILFDPEWGQYDLAIGESITSVFGGSADQKQFPMYEPPSQKTPTQQEYDENTEDQFLLYQRLRNMRKDGAQANSIRTIASLIQSMANADWLLVYEALELLESAGGDETLLIGLKNKLSAMLDTAHDDQRILINYALQRKH